MKLRIVAFVFAALLASAGVAGSVSLTPSTPPAGLKLAPIVTGGRVVMSRDGYTYQWPGTYFETRFRGRELYFKIGPGDVILQAFIDGQRLAPLVKPSPGFYRIGDLKTGSHDIRIEVASESQAGPDQFDGFFLASGGKPKSLPLRTRRIEFIGDSHTVGYGNISPTRECTTDQVWATTDNTQAFGPLIAHHYNADYRINAISGRGIVRNYNGFEADHLPEAYPFILFNRSVKDEDVSWQPQVIVIALGTNDFSTPLNPNEKWPTRDALHADYEQAYVAFVQSLRKRYPKASFVLWATDLWEGEIQAEVEAVTAKLRASGETKITFVPMHGLTMTGCHTHPSVADDKTLANILIKAIDAIPDAWQKR